MLNIIAFLNDKARKMQAWLEEKEIKAAVRKVNNCEKLLYALERARIRTIKERDALNEKYGLVPAPPVEAEEKAE